LPGKKEINLLIELNKSELKRIKIFILGLFIILLVAVLNFLFFLDEISTIFHNPASYPAIVGWIVLMIIYEIIFYRIIRYYLSQKKPFPTRLKLIYIVDETMFPTVLLFLILFLEQKPVLLDSPVVFLYYILIIVSALHLSFGLSMITGIASAVGYLAALVFTFQYMEVSPGYELALPQSIYYSRIYYFLFAGLGAAMVAREINIRIRKSIAYLDQKENIEMLFGQQVSKEVVDALIKQKDQSRQLEATVMFFDVRAFTAIAEKLDSKQVIELQNSLLGPLIEIVNEHQGCINQILGDGFMATFGAPVESPQHAVQAIEAGRKMLLKIELLKKNTAIPDLKVGIGLHTGKITTGNIGNKIRQQYSVSGKAVIIAARLEQLNKKYNTQFLISHNVMEKIPDFPIIATKLAHERLKGFEDGIDVYKIA